MPQVYAAVSDGGGNYLIARKRLLNQWWAEYAAPVLAMEALALVCQTNADPAQDWNTARVRLGNAYQAANGVLCDGIPVFPDAASALDRARNACIATPDGKVIANNALFAVQNLIDVTIARRPAIPFSPCIKADTATLASSIAAAGGNPLQWNTPRAQAEAIAAALDDWAAAQPPSIVNQAAQWALPGGGIHDGESPETAARREFAEETGFSLDNSSDFPSDPPVQLTDPKRKSFWLACFSTRLSLDDIATSINRATVPRASGNRPTSSAVCDWEIEGVQRVEKSQLRAYLGTYQVLSRAAVSNAAYAQARIDHPGSPTPTSYDRRWQASRRHAIDWYALIAMHLQVTV
ncbi:NUDIX hydrolase [Xanthomonas sp. BRIP62418]|uniref:NUDIX hydrolase n=1 Tax=Xanthomonas sp. BRIP62418 TaxID=2182391 RepID=UPI0019D234CA|nr:NUDIX hydrolase [Xanthomonas sp. BRIP62418]